MYDILAVFLFLHFLSGAGALALAYKKDPQFMQWETTLDNKIYQAIATVLCGFYSLFVYKTTK